jgi:hypothetical protein
MLENVLDYGIINWLPILLRTQYVVTRENRNVCIELLIVLRNK